MVDGLGEFDVSVRIDGAVLVEQAAYEFEPLGDVRVEVGFGDPLVAVEPVGADLPDEMSYVEFLGVACVLRGLVSGLLQAGAQMVEVAVRMVGGEFSAVFRSVGQPCAQHPRVYGQIRVGSFDGVGGPDRPVRLTAFGEQAFVEHFARGDHLFDMVVRLRAGDAVIPVPPFEPGGEVFECGRGRVCDDIAFHVSRILVPFAPVVEKGVLQGRMRDAQRTEHGVELRDPDAFAGLPCQTVVYGLVAQSQVLGVESPVAVPAFAQPFQEGLRIVDGADARGGDPASAHPVGRVGESQRVVHPVRPVRQPQWGERVPTAFPDSVRIQPFVAGCERHAAQDGARPVDGLLPFEAGLVFFRTVVAAVPPRPRAPLVVSAGFDRLPVGQDDLVHVIIPYGAHAEDRVGFPVARVQQVAILQVAQRDEPALGETLLRGHGEGRVEVDGFA